MKLDKYRRMTLSSVNICLLYFSCIHFITNIKTANCQNIDDSFLFPTTSSTSLPSLRQRTSKSPSQRTNTNINTNTNTIGASQQQTTSTTTTTEPATREDLEKQIQDSGQLPNLEEEEIWQKEIQQGTTSTPNSHSKPVDDDHDHDPLFLTPLIRDGRVDLARNLSLDIISLSHIKSPILGSIRSHSGFFTINETLNSHLFFWFFPALEDSETAPLFLWINERVGVSSLQGTFVKIGPFYVDKDGYLQERQHTWIQKFNVLFIDSPVGTGFSFTENDEGYANSAVEEAEGMYEALLQFFTVFPDLKDNDFYLAGETYAGVFIPTMTLKIHSANLENDPERSKINLRGLSMGSPFIDSMHQLQWAEYLLNLGLIDEHQYADMRDEERKLISLIKRGKWNEVSKVTAELSGAFPKSLYRNFTGLPDCRNVLVAKVPETIGNFLKFVETNEVHDYLHVGKRNFTYFNSHVRQHFFSDPSAILRPDKSSLEKVLDLGYNVLIYCGQLDGLITHLGLTKVVHNLNWKNAHAFLKSSRKIWMINGTVAGYFHAASNLIHMVVRNAGNMASVDQPARVLKMMEAFTGSDDDW